VNRYDPLIPAKASANDELNAFVGHGRADISARILLAAFFELVRFRQPSSDKLEQVSAYSVILILLATQR